MRAAVVAATSHDPPTLLVRTAADSIPRLLRDAADLDDVLVYFDGDAKLDNLFTGLCISRRKRKLVFGFFAAHGSEEGLHEQDDELLLELQTCKQFDEAILVLCSCLQTGRFPEEVVQLKVGPRRCVRFVIGYEEKMAIPNPDYLKKNDPEFPAALQDVIEAHVLPMLRNMSVPETVEAIKQKWKEQCEEQGWSTETRFVCSFNIGRIRYW